MIEDNIGDRNGGADLRRPLGRKCNVFPAEASHRGAAVAVQPTAGRNVVVHYVGAAWSTGREFDASWDRGVTFDFRLGGGQVIQGWDQGVIGMKVGGRRRLTIPPAMG